ncbi:MAG TPA: hypothetical protein VHB97_12735 [Polyangia bacterium]|nr:hypothetical protein [Polyangia bacterium]
MNVRSLAVTLMLAAGCGNAQAPMTAPDMARAATDHPLLWRVMQGSGPVQAAPEVWTVVWQGDEAIGAEVADFLDWMLHSDYWVSSLGEYGIGAGVSKGLVVIPSPPPDAIDDGQLATLATQLVTSGQITRSDNTQVAFLPSPATTVTAGSSAGCDVFLGYHSHGGSASSGVAYSINLRCTGDPGDPLDQITGVLSHETAEAATDPEPRSGFADVSPGQQEVGDLCEFGLDVAVDVPPDATHAAARRYWLQRLYSDKRAADGTIEPCLPIPWDHPYWNVAIDPKIIDVAPGTTAPADARLDVFAYGDVGLIKWIASSSDADVEPPSGEAHAGDTIAITVTPFQSLQAGQSIEVDILSESAKAGSQLWIGYEQARSQ